MVEDISPSYYAAGNYRIRFTVTGRGFDNLPSDVVGTISFYNDDPLRFRYETGPNFYCTIISKSNSEIVLAAAGAVEHSALYLGAILSNDRETIFWINETRPLP